MGEKLMIIGNPILVVDIDGTISDSTHRDHLVEGAYPDWDAFFDQAKNDLPINSTLKIIDMLAPNVELWVITGRSKRIFNETSNWLRNVARLNYSRLLMREQDDYRPATRVKPELLLKGLRDYRKGTNDVLAIIDNDTDMCEKWDSLGFKSLQVRGK
jgi:phosphoglycolate phosphatase-like HAD superfamily hydrolase